MTKYRGGASSTSQLQSDGWFSFTVPGGSAGVYVGLVDVDTGIDPWEQTHSLHFSGSVVRVMENGAEVLAPVAHTVSAVYSIVRYNGHVFYCAGPPGATVDDARIPFYIPGTVFFASKQPLPGPVFLDATLRLGGDSVVGAALHEEPTYNEAQLSFRPLAVAALVGDVNSVRVSFEPLIATGAMGDGARIVLEPAEVYARQDDYNAALVTFSPMNADATSDFEARVGATLFTGYPTVSAGAPGTMLAEAKLSFGPLAMKAGDYDYTDARVAFVPPTVAAGGRQSGGPVFDFTLPAFSGALPAALRLDVLGGEAVGTETLYPVSFALVVGDAVGDDEVFGGTQRDALLEVDAVAVGAVLGYESSLVVDASDAVGEDTIDLSSTLLTSDDAVADDLTLPASATAADLDSGAVADSAALPYAFFDAVANDGVADDGQVLETLALLSDEAVADDTVLDSGAAAATLESVAAADDVTEILVSSMALADESAVADDTSFTKRADLVAWVMNTKNGAVSWYDNWAFTSMATVGGKVFAAGPDGLSVLGGDTDDQDPIDAHIQYGLLEFGGYDKEGGPKPNPQKKRVQSIWFGYHASGELAATVETYGQGYGPYTYTMPPRSAEQPRNSRVVPGKGLNARYWRLRLSNLNGCGFELHSIGAETAESTRRI